MELRRSLYKLPFLCLLLVVVTILIDIIMLLFSYHRYQGSSVSTVSDYGLDDRAIGVRSPAGAKDFPLPSVPTPALRPTQPPVQ
jgi:hypothetical protein